MHTIKNPYHVNIDWLNFSNDLKTYQTAINYKCLKNLTNKIKLYYGITGNKSVVINSYLLSACSISMYSLLYVLSDVFQSRPNT